MGYKPPQSYQAQYGGDNDFFFQQLESYKQQVVNIDSYDTESSYVPPSTAKSSQYDDREDGLTHQVSALSGDRDSQILSDSSGAAYNQDEAQNEDMINLYTCDFSEFAAHMATQYGKEAFAQGYEVISKHKDLIYTEEGEEALVGMLRHLFKGEDVIRGFLNFCTSYIIVQNYS